jgi:hypothetical protein
MHASLVSLLQTTTFVVRVAPLLHSAPLVNSVNELYNVFLCLEELLMALSGSERVKRHRAKKKAQGEKSGTSFSLDKGTGDLVNMMAKVLSRPKAEVLRVIFMRGLTEYVHSDVIEFNEYKELLARVLDCESAAPEERATLRLVREAMQGRYNTALQSLLDSSSEVGHAR